MSEHFSFFGALFLSDHACWPRYCNTLVIGFKVKPWRTINLTAQSILVQDSISSFDIETKFDRLSAIVCKGVHALNFVAVLFGDATAAGS